MRLLLVGDIMLGRLVNERLQVADPRYPWGDTLSVMRQADLRIGNLECVLADHGEPWSATPKVFHFRSDAKNVAVLRAAGIDAVSLANNHTLDYGYAALDEMLAILDAASIGHAGAGRTLAEAARPAILQARGQRVGLLAFTDNEPAWEATPERAGVLYVPVALDDSRARHLLALVRETRPAVDVLVVAAHWGPNWGDEPPRAHVRFGRALLEAGADIVMGHSAHVWRAAEFVHEGLILYCLGDFVDDYAVSPDERNDETGLCLVMLEGRAVRKALVYPAMIDEMRVCLAGPDDRERIASRLLTLSESRGTRGRWHQAPAYVELSPG
jgi:poly-gamma-glutamate capsule biosynthesis protein CapA/YwtB (metallophosphatase superfamily)